MTNTRYAFFHFVTPRYVLVDRSRARELWWFPHNAALADLTRNMAVVLGGSGNKLRAIGRVLGAMRRRWK